MNIVDAARSSRASRNTREMKGRETTSRVHTVGRKVPLVNIIICARNCRPCSPIIYSSSVWKEWFNFVKTVISNFAAAPRLDFLRNSKVQFARGDRVFGNYKAAACARVSRTGCCRFVPGCAARARRLARCLRGTEAIILRHFPWAKADRLVSFSWALIRADYAELPAGCARLQKTVTLNLLGPLSLHIW